MNAKTDTQTGLIEGLSAPATEVVSGTVDPLLTLIIATAFGAVVAVLHLLAHRERPTFRLWRTLLLIAPLIAMATMAVGSNLAAAFTLFGTLAIVRFRTPIKEPMDAAFVIFSVVIGLATGNQSFMVATTGTIVIAVTILILLGINRFTPRVGRARLKLVIRGIDTPTEVWESTLARREIRHQIRSCTLDKAAGTQSLTVELPAFSGEGWSALLGELIALDEVETANGGPLED